MEQAGNTLKNNDFCKISYIKKTQRFMIFGFLSLTLFFITKVIVWVFLSNLILLFFTFRSFYQQAFTKSSHNFMNNYGNFLKRHVFNLRQSSTQWKNNALTFINHNARNIPANMYTFFDTPGSQFAKEFVNNQWNISNLTVVLHNPSSL